MPNGYCANSQPQWRYQDEYFFVGEGNIGGDPEFQEFPLDNDEPRRLLRMNVYFDITVPRDGSYEIEAATELAD